MLDIWLEPLIAHDGMLRIFAHIVSDRVFGNARAIKEQVPKGCWVTIPPKYQPVLDWYLVRHCDFVLVGEVALDDGLNVVLEKVS